MIASLLLAATSLLSPERISGSVTLDVRSTYLSLGKIVEDAPMHISNARIFYDLGDFGKIGFRNWDVTSLSDRRTDVHRHLWYHTECGLVWYYDLKIADGWKLSNDLTSSWTIYDGFEDDDSNKTYWWWQLDQSLANPYVVPFWRIRRCVDGSDYLYCRIGLRRKFSIWEGLYITPELALDGGNARNQKRVFGNLPDGGGIGDGFYSISPRLEIGWRYNEYLTVFAWIEQYEVLGAARDANAASSNKCLHNDWTHGGVGLRVTF